MKALKQWRLLLTLVLVFAAGVGSGLAWTHWQLKRGFAKALRYETWINGTMDTLQNKLHLTPEQLPKVRALVEEAGQEVKTSLSQAAGDIGSTLMRFGQRLDTELSPEQRRIHERMQQEFRINVSKTLNLDLTQP